MNLPSTTPSSTSAITSIAEAIVERQFQRLANVFDPNINFQALTPGGLSEARGAEDAIALFSEWFGDGYDQ